jgi:hypothetical protein
MVLKNPIDRTSADGFDAVALKSKELKKIRLRYKR